MGGGGERGSCASSPLTSCTSLRSLPICASIQPTTSVDSVT